MAIRKVTVTLGGAEVAKWWRRVLGDKHGMDWDKSSTYFPVGGSFPIWRDNDDPLEIPYLGEETYVELRINPSAIGNIPDLDMGQLAIKVIRRLQQEEAPIGQCNRLQIRIEEAG